MSVAPRVSMVNYLTRTRFQVGLRVPATNKSTACLRASRFILRTVTNLCPKFRAEQSAAYINAQQTAPDDPRPSAHNGAPSPRSTSRPFPATRTAAFRLARASSPRYAADRATENPRCQLLQRRIPRLRTDLRDGLTVVAEYVRWMFPQSLTYDQYRVRIQRHRYRSSSLRLIGVHPRHPPYQVHLRPPQTGDVGGA